MADAGHMRIGGKLVGGTELKLKLRLLAKQAPDLMLAGLLAGGEVIRSKAVDNIRGGPDSASGVGPGTLRNQSGTLRRSIHVEPE